MWRTGTGLNRALSSVSAPKPKDSTVDPWLLTSAPRGALPPPPPIVTEGRESATQGSLRRQEDWRCPGVLLGPRQEEDTG